MAFLMFLTLEVIQFAKFFHSVASFTLISRDLLALHVPWLLVLPLICGNGMEDLGI